MNCPLAMLEDGGCRISVQAMRGRHSSFPIKMQTRSARAVIHTNPREYFGPAAPQRTHAKKCEQTQPTNTPGSKQGRTPPAPLPKSGDPCKRRPTTRPAWKKPARQKTLDRQGRTPPAPLPKSGDPCQRAKTRQHAPASEKGHPGPSSLRTSHTKLNCPSHMKPTKKKTPWLIRPTSSKRTRLTNRTV